MARTGRPTAELVLSKDERETLSRWARRQTLIAMKESANRLDPSKSDTRRRQAERAIAGTTSDRNLVEQNRDTFLRALERRS